MAVDEFGREVPVPSRPRPSTPPFGNGVAFQAHHHSSRHHGPLPSTNLSHFVPSSPTLPTPTHYHHYHHHPSHHLQHGPPPFTGPGPGRSLRRSLESPQRRHTSQVNQDELLAKIYQTEPLLCEYVWKDKQKKIEDSSTNKGIVELNDTASKGETGQPRITANTVETTTEITPSTSSSNKDYDEYRKSYCLRFIRAFFNYHLDDSWFRERYSPAVRRRVALQDRSRAAAEARIFTQQLTNSLEAFVSEASLSGGVKERDDAIMNSSNKVPKSHVFSVLDRALHIQDIPSYVTNEQIESVLLEHCGNAAVASYMNKNGGTNVGEQQRPFEIYALAPPHRSRLLRDVLVLAAQPAMVEAIVAHLTEDQDRRKQVNAAVPRKEGGSGAKAHETVWLDMELDASDPYGRLEHDADGKGGAPPDGMAISSRKATVRLAKYNREQVVVVLSAALSSPNRFSKDKTAAILMARALDIRRDIPTKYRLDEMLDALKEKDDAAILDVAIAYLRRVHLFSFYNGCALSDNLAEVLLRKNPASTIHLRLATAKQQQIDSSNVPENADANGNSNENAATADENTNVAEPVKDLLVQRLDDSISRSLELCEKWIQLGKWVVDEETDRDAQAIEEAEINTTDIWLQNHSIIDDDRRARCSFHFCHKLFKDESFLRKHLIKKHGEFLKAEQAKCHDEFMMKAWDAEENRPVPDIMVDCGKQFKLQAVAVTGREPDCVDPEPELWRKEEEKRQREAEQKQRRDEQRLARKETEEKRTVFVDVDDMKEEKVELSFENAQVPPLVTKKKKKRKLL